MLHRHLAIPLLCLSCASIVLGQEQQPGKLEPHELKFAELLTNATLIGTFSNDSRPDTAPRPEKYVIQSATKHEGDVWIIHSRIVYGDNNVVVPVPVQVKWAGDTPMIQLTDQSIPPLGSGFTARVLFYDNQYAGTWKHGKVGGQMWGKVERSAEQKN